jgi:hypothetical protein
LRQQQLRAPGTGREKDTATIASEKYIVAEDYKAAQDYQFLETTGEYPWNESQDFSVLAMGSLASMVLDSRC